MFEKTDLKTPTQLSFRDALEAESEALDLAGELDLIEVEEAKRAEKIRDIEMVANALNIRMPVDDPRSEFVANIMAGQGDLTELAAILESRLKKARIQTITLETVFNFLRNMADMNNERVPGVRPSL